MRNDAIGLFWEDIPAAGSRGARGPRIIPPVPETGWRPPMYLPDLSGARAISVDVETKDPELTDYTDENGVEHPGKGPGWARGVGHIVGVSIGADGGGRWYFPIRHEFEPEYNWDPQIVLDWLKVELGRPHQPKIGANIIYDIGWLKHEGVEVRGPIYDVQYAEALLDERSKVALEILAQKYLGEGKDSSLMYDWLSRAYGGPATDKQRKNIWRCPPRLVGPYATSDADLPLRIIGLQWQAMGNEGLLDLFSMECRLIPLLIEMRFAGVRVHIPRATELYDNLCARVAVAQIKLNAIAMCTVDVNIAETLERACQNNNIPYPRTAKGKASFRANWLDQLEHPLGAAIREVRKLTKLKDVFLQSYILRSHKNGMLYGQFHSLRGDTNGTRSGRLSGSNPNLQNIPSRDEELAPLLRALFVPDEGHEQWRRYDYSQIEYRFLIHFARGPSGEDARRLFNEHPDTDYHEFALDLVAPVANWDISTKEKRKLRRKPVKTINFGLVFGMGVDKLSNDLGLTRKEGKDLFKAYHKAVPFAKETMDWCADEARATGTVRTILNRASRFDLWEPIGWETEGPALPYDQALRSYGNNIERAFLHKALNRKLQGSAADLMKSAMLQCYEDGVFDYTGVPRLTVHDELDFSDPGGKEDGFAEVKRIMENAIKLRIPVVAEMEKGADWGHCE